MFYKVVSDNKVIYYNRSGTCDLSQTVHYMVHLYFIPGSRAGGPVDTLPPTHPSPNSHIEGTLNSVNNVKTSDTLV